MPRLFLRIGLFFLCWLAGPAGLGAELPDLARMIISPEGVLARTDELQLTAAQRLAVEREQAAQRAILAAPTATKRRATEALFEQLSLEKPDGRAVLARFEELNDAETILKRERIATTVRLKNLLTPAQLARWQAPRSPALTAPGLPGPTIPEMLEQVRMGIDAWRRAGRDLTTVNAAWERFRHHAEAREHAQARQTLQELIVLLSAPPPAQSPQPSP